MRIAEKLEADLRQEGRKRSYTIPSGLAMGMLSLTKFECAPEFFAEISKSLLLAGKSVRFNALGDSMFPFIQNGDLVVIKPVKVERIKTGDIIFYEDVDGNCLLHRIIRRRSLDGSFEFQIQADNILTPGGWVSEEQVFGRLSRFCRNDVWVRMDRIGTKVISVLILAQLKLNLNRYRRFRSSKNYFRHLAVLCRLY